MRKITMWLYEIGIGCMLATFILFGITFLTGYFTPEKEVLIVLNKYGEAQLEFILLLIILPLSIFTTVGLTRYLPRKST